MDTEALRTFLAVQRLRSFTAAAQELHLSQPAVSRRIQGLEEELGVPLLERLGRQVSPTGAGRTLVAEAERVLGDCARLTEAVRAHARPGHDIVRLGASTTPGLYVLPRVIAALEADGVRCSFGIANSDDITRGVRANELDLGVIGGEAPDPHLRATVVFTDRITCFAGPDHPITRQPTLSPAVLRAQVWIVREPGSATRRLVEQWMARGGWQPERTVEVQGPEAARRLVEAGMGVAAGSMLGVQRAVEEGRLALVPVPGLDLRRPLCIVHHTDKFLSPSVALVLERLLGACRSMRTDIPSM